MKIKSIALPGFLCIGGTGCLMQNGPPCAIAQSFIGFDGSTPAGKRHFAMASMALALNLKLEGQVDRAVCAPQGNVALLASLRATK